MEEIFEKVLFTHDDIVKMAKRVASEINHDYEGQDLVIICMLKGGAPWMMELIKHLEVKTQIDFMQISSYHGGTHASDIVFKKDIEASITNRNVLIVDDIIDSGETMQRVIDLFKTRNAKTLEVCCMLDKPYHRKNNLHAKYVGSEVEDAFLVGFGLDYEEYYRNVPEIGIFKKELIK